MASTAAVKFSGDAENTLLWERDGIVPVMSMSQSTATAASLWIHQDHCPKQSWAAPGVNTHRTPTEKLHFTHTSNSHFRVLCVCTTRTGSWKSSPTPVKSFSKDLNRESTLTL